MFLKKTILIALLLAALLLFAACTAPSGSPSETTAAPTDIPSETTASADNITDPPTASGTEAPSGETTAEETTAEETTAEETTELVLTASPSLGSVEDVLGVGLRYGDTILEGLLYGGSGGVMYNGAFENGTVNWSPMEGPDSRLPYQDILPLAPGCPISKVIPVLIVPLGEEIEIINHSGREITEDRYTNYKTGERLPVGTAPTEAGIYILRLYIHIPLPTEPDPSIEIGTVFRDLSYYFIVMFEK